MNTFNAGYNFTNGLLDKIDAVKSGIGKGLGLVGNGACAVASGVKHVAVGAKNLAAGGVGAVGHGVQSAVYSVLDAGNDVAMNKAKPFVEGIATAIKGRELRKGGWGEEDLRRMFPDITDAEVEAVCSMREMTYINELNAKREREQHEYDAAYINAITEYQQRETQTS